VLQPLTPVGATDSQAMDIFEGLQVGSAKIDGVVRASLWSGTADSWVDLHAFLPSSFSSSFANAISRDGNTWSIVGYGFNEETQRTEALMWAAAVPEPGTLTALLVSGLAMALRRRRRS